MKDEKGRLNKLTFDGSGKINHAILQSGEFEGGILCEECDNNILGGEERYVAKILYGKNFENPPIRESYNFNGSRELLKFSNFDYKRFKLFILWRSSISSRPMFNYLSLGETLEDEIKKVINDGDAREDTKFPIILSTWRYSSKEERGIVSSPISIEISGGISYLYIINGLAYWVFSSEEIIPKELKELRLKSDGTVILYDLPEILKKYIDNKA
ncbi:hypothetical protein V6R21_24610 [Limibacter armeniacum]|uniref:hypothetical protein n=1 Tax=Limibacter armeniacum TaxID=466084 RepID=UPI002FE5BDD9